MTNWHSSPIQVISTITTNEIFVNTSEMYCILPRWSKSSIGEVAVSWQDHLHLLSKSPNASQLTRRDPKPSKLGYDTEATGLIEGILGIDSGPDALPALEAFVTAMRKSTPPNRDQKFRRMYFPIRYVEFLFLLWKHGLIAFPGAHVFAGGSDLPQGRAIDLSEHFFGDMGDVLAKLVAPLKHGGQARAALKLMLACSKPSEIGDIDYAVLQLFRPLTELRNHQSIVYGICDQIHIQQRSFYHGNREAEQALPQSYREIFVRKKGEDRSSETFQWAVGRGGQKAKTWRLHLTEYLNTITNRIGMRHEITHLNLLLDYVIEVEDVPELALDYCRRDFTPAVSIASYQSTNRNLNESGAGLQLRIIGKFFDWVISTSGSDEDGVPLREFRNPVDTDDLPVESRSKGQTDRAAIPLRFLRMLKEIIEADDFAWPRSVGSDYMEHLDPKTGQRTRIWSPVRANYFLLRLILPIRSLQARLLDSGEGDFEILTSDLIWERNKGPHAPEKQADRRNTGLIRKIWDHHTGRAFNGLFITTNKTQDREELFTESGYEIPWENPEVVQLFCRMRDWQVKYNPITRPLSRGELKSDKKLVVSSDLADRLEKLHFLFRDAADPDFPHEPPTDGRLYVFWRLLMHELERRLDAAGQKNSDGSKIELVTFRPTGSPKSTLFDMHSLRVAGLTAFIDAGVPIHILSEFVAGHATILMTLYYYKPGAAEITRVLDNALLEMGETESRNWDTFLKGHSTELIHEIAAYNSDEGIRAATATQSSLWAPMSGGICPNGATLCDRGGPILNEGRQVYAPVPGGPKNCPLCRYFVTGPAFLGGLVAAFNQTGGQIRELFGFLQENQQRRRVIVADSGTLPADPRTSGELVALDEAVQSTQAKLEVLSKTWVSQLRLIQQIEKIIELRANGAKNALVLNGQIGDLRISLQESTEFEMWDRICQSSDFYPNVDARLPAIRRGRMFDLMLKRNGRAPVFATLSDQQLIAVGNEAANLLRSIVGEPNVEDLIAGRQALDDLGVGQQLEDFVQQRVDGSTFRYEKKALQ